MNLPANTRYQTQQPRWISFTEPAWIQLDHTSANARQYTIKERRLDQAIGAFAHGDWAGIAFQQEASAIVYSGADHGGTPLWPNITILPDVPARAIHGETSQAGSLEVLGCTMGHWHVADPKGSRSQEIYEYQSYGLMVLDREQGEPELWVLREGDKVAVPSGCHMTLYNLGGAQQPLVTLDFANPTNNTANKHLIGALGPILLAYRTRSEAVFTLNRLYLNSAQTQAGVRLKPTDLAPRELQVRIPINSNQALGPQLYEKLTADAGLIARFDQLGLRLKRATPQATLLALDGRTTTLTQPLVEETRPGAAGYRFFLG
jgi:hypothetical protein